jgi:hypothetical protein
VEDPNGGGIDPVTIRRGSVAQGIERSPNAEDVVVAVATLAFHLTVRPVLSFSLEPTYGPWWANIPSGSHIHVEGGGRHSVHPT